MSEHKQNAADRIEDFLKWALITWAAIKFVGIFIHK